MAKPATRWPAWQGGVLALVAAVLFGLTTPVLQIAGREVGAFLTASLLYAGAALVAVFTRAPRSKEARVNRSDVPALLGMAAFGAVIAPVALAWGLQQTSATSASLLLTFEALFTIAFARWMYSEVIDKRVWLAIAMLLAGGLLLVADRYAQGAWQLMGLLAVGVATAAWGLDNTLSRAVADRDPAQVVAIKGALGAAVTALIAWAVGERLPSASAALSLLVIGATGYGLSLRFYLLAQRSFGAARTGSVFAFAPFVGAMAAFVLGERGFSSWFLWGSLLMLFGVILHLMENHVHEHAHEALEHEHAHRHDDGHHHHDHDPMPSGQHSHMHTHTPVRHSHSHAPDLHHRHIHD